VNAGFIVGLDHEKGRVADDMIACIEAAAIPVCTVGLLYALPNTQLTRRLEREGRLFPTSYSMDLAVEQGAGDQCTNGLNFQTMRPRRDVLADYKSIVQRIYRPSAYYGRVRTVARLLDRPALDRSCNLDPPPARLAGVDRRDLALLWGLVWRIALRQPTALPHFCKVFYECARTNPRALVCVCILAALYLHLRPFSRFIVSSVDRQIASIDAGAWERSLPGSALAEAR
jgi:hypothetical protein